MSAKRYCICRSKQGSGFMVACESCDEWFHGKCVGINKKHASNIINYFCQSCMDKNPSLAIVYKVPPNPATEKIETKQIKLENSSERKIPDKSNTALAPASRAKHKNNTQTANHNRRKPGVKFAAKNRKQCANPDCTYECRFDSKYCSDDCGYTFNKMRYETHFIPKYKILEKNHSKARLDRMKQLDQLETDKTDVEDLIKNLKEEKEELDRNIKMIKEAAKEERGRVSFNTKDNDDDDADVDNDDAEGALSGDLAKTFCITCGISISTSKAFSHWSLCHKKFESQYAYTADVAVNYSLPGIDENPKLYCHHQDKKTKRYCMNLESACPQHNGWSGDKDEVCGCPTEITQKVEPVGPYCLELKKDCTLHYHWDKFRLTQINMQRLAAFNRRDVILERLRVISANLDDTYGGIVGVMLHSTENCQLAKDEQDKISPNDHQDQMDVDVEC